MIDALERTSIGVNASNQDRLPESAPEIFGELNVSAGIALISQGRFEEMEPGATFIQQGQQQSDLAIILDGQLKVFCQASGQVIQLANLEPGETVGEMSMLDRGKASATVTAACSTLVWRLGRATFENFVKDYPDDGVRLFWILSQKLCKRLRKSSDRMLRQAEGVRLSCLDRDY